MFALDGDVKVEAKALSRKQLLHGVSHQLLQKRNVFGGTAACEGTMNIAISLHPLRIFPHLVNSDLLSISRECAPSSVVGNGQADLHHQQLGVRGVRRQPPQHVGARDVIRRERRWLAVAT